MDGKGRIIESNQMESEAYLFEIRDTQLISKLPSGKELEIFSVAVQNINY